MASLAAALEQAEKAAKQFEELARIFMAAGVQLQEAMAQVSALLAIEKAKQED